MKNLLGQCPIGRHSDTRAPEYEVGPQYHDVQSYVSVCEWYWQAWEQQTQIMI